MNFRILFLSQLALPHQFVC